MRTAIILYAIGYICWAGFWLELDRRQSHKWAEGTDYFLMAILGGAIWPLWLIVMASRAGWAWALNAPVRRAAKATAIRAARDEQNRLLREAGLPTDD